MTAKWGAMDAPVAGGSLLSVNAGGWGRGRGVSDGERVLEETAPIDAALNSKAAWDM